MPEAENVGRLGRPVLREAATINRDIEHLNLLSVFYYVMGALNALGGFGCMMYFVIGLVIFFMPEAPHEGPAVDGPPLEAIGGGMAAASLGVALLIWTGSALLILAGRRLSQGRSYVFCMVIAVLECINVPFGTALGVCTIIVLLRPSVKALFDAGGTASKDVPATI